MWINRNSMWKEYFKDILAILYTVGYPSLIIDLF